MFTARLLRCAGLAQLTDFNGLILTESVLASPLSDLDELVLKCRDKKAQSYIREAVSCYKTGAFRSAIVSTWIAVSFDIIDKIKELSISGDKEAISLLGEFETIRLSHDLSGALKFERSILDAAKDKLELISSIEHTDLSRLQEDRNRCAHPSMTADGEIFNPSAELARLHIRSAVEYLLQYPPAQGKAALDRLRSEITSEYFPQNIEKAIVTLMNTPLVRARSSLINNLIVILIKQVLEKNKTYKQKKQLFAALNAVKKMYYQEFCSVLNDKLSSIVEKLGDAELGNVLNIINYIDISWDFLNSGLKQKIGELVENFPVEKIDSFEFIFNHKDLSKHATIRAKALTRSEIGNEFFFFNTPKQITDRVVKLYLDSLSFDQANSFASTVREYSRYFSKEQVAELINACVHNYQISNSFEVVSVINALRKNENVDDEFIDEFLKKNKTSEEL